MDLIGTRDTQVETLVAQLQLRVSELERYVTAQSAELEELRDANAAQDRKLAWLQSEVGDLQMDIGNYSTRLTEMPFQWEEDDD